MTEDNKEPKLPEYTSNQKVKLLKILRVDINTKLMLAKRELTKNPEDEKIIEKINSLLSDLKGIQLNLFKIERNKNQSKFYDFIPSGKINRQQRRMIK